MKPQSRKYQVADSLMLQHAKTMLGLFTTDQAQFAAYDSDLGSPFEIEWENLIGQCENHLPDSAVRSQQAQHTVAVKAEMKACCATFTELRYFVRKAFPDRIDVWNAFGLAEFNKKRNSQIDLLELMKVAHSMATQYSAQLQSANYTPTNIAEIETRHLALEDALNAQYSAKKQRNNSTAIRIKTMNSLWETMRTISHVAKYAFEEGSVRPSQYLLLWPAPRKPKQTTEE